MKKTIISSPYRQKQKHKFVFQESAVEMIRNIREAFNELLDENEWMDKETKLLAKEKADSINERIGYPEILTKSEELEAEYQQVRFEKLI